MRQGELLISADSRLSACSHRLFIGHSSSFHALKGYSRLILGRIRLSFTPSLSRACRASAAQTQRAPASPRRHQSKTSLATWEGSDCTRETNASKASRSHRAGSKYWKSSCSSS